MTSIPCPQCQSKIEFDPVEAFKGIKLTCSNCNCVMTLKKESNKDILAKGAKALEKLKDEFNLD